MIPDFAVITTLRQFQYALDLVPAELRFASVHGDEKLFVLCDRPPLFARSGTGENERIEHD